MLFFRRGVGMVLGAAAGTLLMAGASLAGETQGELLKAPASPVPPLLDRAKVDVALDALDGLVMDAMTKTGVPGIAVAVIYKDQVLYAKGFGVREVGRPEKIDPDTVFLLASVSKPIASTVVAGVVGQGLVQWDDPVISHNPGFALSDLYVTKNATFADLLSHRSGLRTGAGDLLEDLGFDRDHILAHLDQQPLDPFRSTYHYSNFGYTEGGIAAAAAAGKSWEDLADDVLFKPLGMTSASSRHADYLKRPDRARIHFREPDGTWVARYDRDPDAEAPAGGASASLNDMIRFLRLQLGKGTFEGKEIIDAAALATPHVPQVIPGPPRGPASRAGFYGLGWNVTYDDEGRVRLGHSGAFNLGTATNITFLPGEDLGIVVLTNARPIGVPETIAISFFDIAQHGHLTVAWPGFIGGLFAAMDAGGKPAVDYARTPASPAPARPDVAYAGTYANNYYGPLTVSADDGLSMTMGPAAAPTTFTLTHFDGDTFTFQTIGENQNGPAGAIFTVGADGKASRVVLDYYDVNGLGTFTRN